MKNTKNKYKVIDIFPEGMDEKTIHRKFQEIIVSYINDNESNKNSGISVSLIDDDSENEKDTEENKA